MLYLMAVTDDVLSLPTKISKLSHGLESMAKYACSASALKFDLLARINSQWSEYVRPAEGLVYFTQMNDHTAILVTKAT